MASLKLQRRRSADEEVTWTAFVSRSHSACYGGCLRSLCLPTLRLKDHKSGRLRHCLGLCDELSYCVAMAATSDIHEFNQAIVNLEDATWRALSNDGAALLPFLSKDCTMLLPLGMKLTHTSEPSLTEVMTSDGFIPWKSYKMRETKVTPLGHEAAVITYMVEATRPPLEDGDEELPFRALIGSVWKFEREGSKWLMCFHQQTPFTPLDS